jgi:hypothetical protein
MENKFNEEDSMRGKTTTTKRRNSFKLYNENNEIQE